MIQLPRSLFRHLHAVFKRVRTKGLPTIVHFHSDGKDLHIGMSQQNLHADFVEPGTCEPIDLLLPLEALADFQGRTEEPVSLEKSAGGQVVARWQDGAIPQVREYESPTERPGQESMPIVEATIPVESVLWPVLAEAVATAARDSTRFALNDILLRGRTGEVVATDGRQLLIQACFTLPWKEDVLIPASPVLGCRELKPDEPLAIAKSDKHVALKVDNWTFHLPIDKDARFPKVEQVIPNPNSASSRCQFDASDMDFLEAALTRLPGDKEDNQPVTLDLDGKVVVRAKAESSGAGTELILERSTTSGKAVQLALNRNLLARALRMDFRELYVSGAENPLLWKDSRRQYVTMPLAPSFAVSAAKDGFHVVSSVGGGPQPKPVQERKPLVNELAPTNGNGDEIASPKRKLSTEKDGDASAGSLLAEAEALRGQLADAYARSRQLVMAVRRQRKQTHALRTTLSTLRQLQQIG